MGNISEATGYHGTSYDFDRFNHKKYLNTGDGSQEFGWGTYVTDNKDIAMEYAERSKNANTGNYDKSDNRITAGTINNIADRTLGSYPGLKREITDSLRMCMYKGGTLGSNTINNERVKYAKNLSPEESASVNAFYDEIEKLNPYKFNAKSYVYEVEIPDDNGSNYLYWFNEIDGSTRQRVADGLNTVRKRYPNITSVIDDDIHTGFNLYEMLSSRLGSYKSASLFLMNLCGYDGIIYPIGTVYGYNGKKGNNYVIFNANKVKIKKKTVSENKMRINEWKPSFFDELPDRIRLYHGTDIMAINDIVESGVISALKGRRHGETYGVNWFSIKYGDNYGRGSNFSIEVPKEDFINGKFKFMNNNDVTSNDDEIPIRDYDFRIEKIGGFKEETFRRIFERLNGDIYDFVNYLNKHNHEFEEYQLSVDYPVVMYLIKQLFGEEPLRKEGIIESRLYINEVEADDVNLSSFMTKDKLNDRLWVNNKLNSRVREKLLDISDDFIDELAMPDFKPEDIVFTGSLANYNWSRYSDIDVHIVISFSSIYKKTELIDDYFKSKKEIWNQTHENLKIYGYPVEISVENSDEPGVSSGVYSLVHNKWVKEPSNFDDAKLNEKYIKEFSAQIMTDIDNIQKQINKNPENSRLERLADKTMKIFKRLKNMRKEGLSRSGEMASGNICWKVMRRTGYLDKIWDIINNTYNKINSIR